MKFRWTIVARSVAIAWGAVILIIFAGLFIQRSTIRHQGVDSARLAMRGILLSAEGTRGLVAEMNASKSFDRKTLVEEAHNSADYRKTRIFSTVPIVAAMKSIATVAAAQGYDFRVPARHPRNSQNTPTAYEERILNALEQGKQEEWFEVTDNEIIYARPVRLTAECLACHGDPATGSKDGKDVLGFRMEGWHEGDLHAAFVLRTKTDGLNRQMKASMESTALWMTPIILLVGLCAYLAMRRIRGPLGETVRALTQVANGDLTTEVAVTTNDEIGDMSGAVKSMIRSLREVIRSVVESIEVVASSATELSASARQMTASSNDASGKVVSVTSSANHMSESVSSVASAMEQTSTNLSHISVSTEQMTTTIDEIARNSEKARRMTRDASDQATRVTEQMNELGNAAREISKVTETITEISSQTNLLALNATIEAARAGAAGKGFAVVANEIKELAQQTATATEDIKSRIEGVQSSALRGINEIARISTLIGEVSEVVSSNAAAIEEQSAVTKDIARNIGEASNGVSEANSQVSRAYQMSSGIVHEITSVQAAATDVADGSQQISISAAELSRVAEQLKGAARNFRL